MEGLISTKLYKKYLPPVLYRLFTVKEYNIRLLLLQTFHSYCHLLDKTRLEKYIMPLVSMMIFYKQRPVAVPMTLFRVEWRGFEVPLEHYSDRHSFHWEIFSSSANAKKLMKNVGLISTNHFSTQNADFS